MKNTNIETDEGDLELAPAESAHLRWIATYRPMEVVGMPDAVGRVDRYGLTFQQGKKEVHGVKLQLPTFSKHDAGVAFYLAPDPASHRDEKVNVGIECDADYNHAP